MANPFYQFKDDVDQGYVDSEIPGAVLGIESTKILKSKTGDEQVHIWLTIISPVQKQGMKIRDVIPVQKTFKWKMGAYYTALGIVNEDNSPAFEVDLETLQGGVIKADIVKRGAFFNLEDVRKNNVEEVAF